MCLILFSWKSHPRYPLVVAANRDEFHDRPTAAAGFWQHSPGILAGRDLRAGGTWLGISRKGRFAAISNYRETLLKTSPREYSRGHLVRDFLLDESSPVSHAMQLQSQGANYNGFNLLLGNPSELFYVSNRKDKPVCVSAGSHGLSNHLLDSDWPKVRSGRALLDSLLMGEQVEAEALLELLAAETAASELSTAGMQLRTEEMNKKIFIKSPLYGTRSSTALLLDRDGKMTFVERQFDADANPTGTQSHTFKIDE